MLLQCSRLHSAVKTNSDTEVVELLQSGVYVDCMQVSYAYNPQIEICIIWS